MTTILDRENDPLTPKNFGPASGWAMLILLYLVLLTTIAGADWSMHGHGAGRNGFSGNPGPTAADVKWTFDFRISIYGGPLETVRLQDNASPIVGPDNTIYQITEVSLYAINPDGTLKWNSQYSDHVFGRLAPALSPDGSRIYAPASLSGSGPTIVALDTHDGTPAWTLQLEPGPWADMTYSSLAVDAEGVIYVGTRNPATLYAINSNGTLKWSYTHPNSDSIGIEAPPAVGPDGSVYCIVNTVGLVALDKNGAFQWSRNDNSGGYGWPTPAVLADGTIVIAGDFGSGSIVAYNPDGSTKWKRVDIGGPGGFFSGVAVSGDQGTIYTAREGGTMYALDSQTGATRWFSVPAAGDDMAGSPVLASNGVIYVMGSQGEIYALGEPNGSLLWKYQLNTPALFWGPPSPALGNDGTLYAAAPGTTLANGDIPGRLYAFKSSGPRPATKQDVDGDGTSDAVVWRTQTRTWFARHSGSGGTTYTAVQCGGQAEGDVQVPGDYDGDGKMDLAVWRPSTGVWHILKSGDGYNCATALDVQWGDPKAGDVPVPADYDGDRTTKMAVFRPTTGEWLFQDGSPSVAWGMRGDIPVPADYNGDGIVELAVFRPTTGTWYVRGGATLAWGMWGDVPVAADYDGDGKAEIAVYRPSTGWWYVAGGSMAQWGAPGDVPVPLDTDGDGVTDFVVYRPGTGMWYTLDPVTGATSEMAWGQTGDEPVGVAPHLPVAPVLKTAGDFDHDGSADVTVFRPSTGVWYTLDSTFAYRSWESVTLGQTGDIPVPGDYQGTGHQERAVYRPSTGEWLLEDGRTIPLGASGDVPVPGDYDGDGIMDIAVFTPGTGQWSLLTGASGFATLVTQEWGASGDMPAPGDYDGDGKTDMAVFTPATGQWTIRSSVTGTTLVTLLWGMSGDIPVPADYDGDGKTDIAVYRPSTGYWYELLSGSGWSSEWAWWGAEGDIPVPADYDGDGKTDVAVYRPSTGAWYVMNVLTVFGWGGTGDVPILSRK